MAKSSKTIFNLEIVAMEFELIEILKDWQIIHHTYSLKIMRID